MNAFLERFQWLAEERVRREAAEQSAQFSEARIRSLAGDLLASLADRLWRENRIWE